MKNRIILEKKEKKIILKIRKENIKDIAVIIKNPDNKEKVFLPFSSEKKNFSSYSSKKIPENYVQKNKDFFFIEFNPEIRGGYKALFIVKNKRNKHISYEFNV